MATLQASSSIIADPLDPDCRFWVGVCIRAHLATSLAFPLVGQMLRVFVGMAMTKGIVSSWEAQAILRRLPKNPSEGMLKTDFVLDLELALHDRDGARMDALASVFEDKIGLRDGE